MNLGLPLRWKNGDYFSQMWHFKRLQEEALPGR